MANPPDDLIPINHAAPAAPDDLVPLAPNQGAQPRAAPSDDNDQWTKTPWIDVGKQAAHNFVPGLVNTLEPVARPFIPQNWHKYVTDLNILGKLGIGLGSKIGAFGADAANSIAHAAGQSDIVAPASAAQRAEPEQFLNDMIDQKVNQYTTEGGFKKAVATDPTGVLMDASMLAGGVEGAGRLASGLPGRAGVAAASVADTARAASVATNPISWLAKGADAMLPKVRVLTGAGEYTPEVQAAIKQAFPTGELTAADLAHPDVKQAMVNVLGKKGIGPQAVREALLTHLGAPAPRSVVSGQPAPAESAAHVQQAKQEGLNNITGRAQGASGAPEPHESDLGAALETAQIAAHNQYNSLYKKAFSYDGTLSSELARQLPNNMSDALKSSSFAADPEALNAYGMENSAKAFQLAQGETLRLAQEGELTPQLVERIRQRMGDYWRDAEGTDRQAMRVVMDSFDNTVENVASMGGLSTGSGAAMAADMRAARGAFRDYQNTFASDKPIDAKIGSALKSMVGQQTKDSSGAITDAAPPGYAAQGQQALSKGLINPKTLAVVPGAQALYNRLKTILGPGDASLDNFIRQSVTKSDNKTGAPIISATPEQLNTFLKSPLANVFSPEEQAMLRQVAQAKRLLSSNPARAAQAGTLLSAITGKLGRTLLGAGIGHFTAGPLGAGAGAIAEQALEPVLAARATQREISGGAKPVGGVARVPGGVMRGVAANPLLTASAAELKQEEDREGRARGGRICAEAEDLMRAADKARKYHSEATKTILNMPDETVARALDLASKAAS